MPKYSELIESKEDFPVFQKELIDLSMKGFSSSAVDNKISPVHGGEKVLFSRDPDLPGMEIRFSRYGGFTFPRHTHDTYTVGVVLEGASYCTDKMSDSLLVAPGDLFHINPEQVHSGVPLRNVGVSYLLFYVEPEWVNKAVQQIFETDKGFPEFTNFCSNSPQASDKFKAFYRCLSLSGTSLAKESIVLTAFAELFKANGRIAPLRSAGNEHHAVSLAREYLENNVSRKVSLDDLASITGLSSYYFLRVFKKSTGMTPHAYFTARRIEKARKLLLNKVPFAEVALDCGFGDQSHFSHKFKQVMGVTPGQYLGII